MNNDLICGSITSYKKLIKNKIIKIKKISDNTPPKWDMWELRPL